MDVIRSTRSFLLVTVIAAASQFVSACYPRAHEYTSSPEVSGVLLRGGVPVSGARVMIAHSRGDDGNYCRDALAVAVTGDDGRFHVDANTHLHLFASLLNSPKYVAELTSVCFEVPEQVKLGVLLMAPTDRKTSDVLSCDLDSPPREFKQHVIWQKEQWGICGNGG
jgi:hypothetical protein